MGLNQLRHFIICDGYDCGRYVKRNGEIYTDDAASVERVANNGSWVQRVDKWYCPRCAHVQCPDCARLIKHIPESEGAKHKPLEWEEIERDNKDLTVWRADQGWLLDAYYEVRYVHDSDYWTAYFCYGNLDYGIYYKRPRVIEEAQAACQSHAQNLLNEHIKECAR